MPLRSLGQTPSEHCATNKGCMMIWNYLLTAWRHIVNNRMFSLINVFGLSVGLMSCILILIYVRDEVSYDKWLSDGDSLVRLHTGYISPDRPPFLTVRSAGKMMEAVTGFASEEEPGLRLLAGRHGLHDLRTPTEAVPHLPVLARDSAGSRELGCRSSRLPRHRLWGGPRPRRDH